MEWILGMLQDPRWLTSDGLVMCGIQFCSVFNKKPHKLWNKRNSPNVSGVAILELNPEFDDSTIQARPPQIV